MDMQSKFMNRIKEIIESADLQFVRKQQWSNTGTVRAQKKDGFKSLFGLCYDFQDGYATIQIYPGDKPIVATCGFTHETCIGHFHFYYHEEAKIETCMKKIEELAGKPKPAKVTTEQAQAAMETLRKYGAQSYNDPAKTPLGTALGMALHSLIGHPAEIMDAAVEALEQSNNHVACATVKALKDGHATRKGLTVSVKLPKYMKGFQDNVVMG